MTRMPASARAAARRYARAGLLAMLVAGAVPGAPADATERPAAERPVFDAVERARIAALGPWPPPPARDPSNRVSGAPAAIELGRRLFADASLSAGGRTACATCHQPALAFTDARPRAQGTVLLERNTQTLLNAAYQRWFGWGGSSDSLWMASLRALLDPREMGASRAHLAKRFARDEDLACRYRRAFGQSPEQAGDRLPVDVAKAIAAYVATLVTPRTPFDEFRDALAAGDAAAMARYPAAAARGLKLFVGRGQCVVCHAGPLLSNGEFHDIGMPFFVAPGVVDPGRHAGIRALRDSPYNLLGAHNDDPVRRTATATRHVDLAHRHWGEWRTPPLREVARTAPYMHDGRLATLRDVLRHYSEFDESRVHADGERLLRPLRLAEPEIDDLLAFLDSLGAREPAPPGPPPGADRCRPGE